MIRRPPRSTRTDTLFPYTTLFRSGRPGGHPERFDAGDMRIAEHDPRNRAVVVAYAVAVRSEEHTSELQSLMRISYAVFCLKKKKDDKKQEKHRKTHNKQDHDKQDL